MEKTIKKIDVWNSSYYVNPNDNTLSFAGAKGKIQVGLETLKEASKAYKGVNIVHKPFYVLVAQQFILKNSHHKMKVAEEISVEQFKADFVPDLIEA